MPNLQRFVRQEVQTVPITYLVNRTWQELVEIDNDRKRRRRHFQERQKLLFKVAKYSQTD